MSNNKYKWIKPGLYTTFDKVAVVLFGLINFIILARLISKNAFGEWVLFTSVVSIVEVLREGFVKSPFIAMLSAADTSQRDTIASASFYLNLVYSVGISLLLFLCSFPLASFWDATLLGPLFKIYAITNLIFVPFTHVEYIQQVAIEYKGIFYSHFTRALLPTLYLVAMFLTGSTIDLQALAWVMCLAGALGAVVCVFFARPLMHRFVKPPASLGWEMFRFGSFTFGTTVSALAVRNTDTWMLGRMVSREGVAAYNPAIRIANLVEIPTLTVANLVFPKLAEQYNNENKDYLRSLYERSVGFVLAIMIPALLVMFFFSDFIVVLVAGEKYASSGYLLKITAFYCFFLPFARQFGIIMDAARKPRIHLFSMVTTALLNVVLNYIFILNWGIAGAALATLSTYMIRFVWQQIILFNLFKIGTPRVFSYAWSFYGQGYAMLKKLIAR